MKDFQIFILMKKKNKYAGSMKILQMVLDKLENQYSLKWGLCEDGVTQRVEIRNLNTGEIENMECINYVQNPFDIEEISFRIIQNF
jgi:hypothetical protein